MTIGDVAAEAGVSVATVSKVINGRWGVAEGTEARVRAVIEDLGYHSSLVAQSLRSRRTNVIGVLVVDIEPFSAELLKGVARAVHGTGYELVVFSGCGADDQVGWERRYLSRVSGTLCDGALLVTPSSVDVTFGAPVVAVDHNAGSSTLPSVDSDNFNGAVTATEYLLGLGHRRIGFLAGRADLESARLRKRGYRHALETAGIAVDPALIRVGGVPAGIRRGRRTAAARERRQPHRDLRGERRLGACHDLGRALARASRAGRPVGDRVRQRPGVGAQRSSADHDRAADPADGLRRDPPPDRADRG